MKNLKFYEGMLIVVDMVNGFVKEGALADLKIGRVVPRQLHLMKEAHEKGHLVVFIQDTHREDSKEHRRFGGALHCVSGTKEVELIDELEPWKNHEDTICIPKNSTSFMEAPKFRELMKETSHLKEIDVVGCCTDICVMNGTMGLANYLDEWNRDVEVRVHTDAIATFGEEARQNYVEAALLLMEQQGIQLVKERKRS